MFYRFQNSFAENIDASSFERDSDCLLELTIVEAPAHENIEVHTEQNM